MEDFVEWVFVQKNAWRFSIIHLAQANNDEASVKFDVLLGFHHRGMGTQIVESHYTEKTFQGFSHRSGNFLADHWMPTVFSDEGNEPEK